MDKPALRPLPSDPYEPAMYKRAKVHVDYHVEIDRRFHSLPRALIGWTIDACVTLHVVEILHGGRRVGRHPRAFSHSTISDHIPAAHRAYREWAREQLRHWTTAIGPAAWRLVDHLLSQKPLPELGYRSWPALLALIRHYEKSRLEAACQRAHRVVSPTRTCVLSILKRGLVQQPLPPPAQTEWVRPEHANPRDPAEFTAPLTRH